MDIALLNTDFEKVNGLLTLLISHATGNSASSADYAALRREVLANQELADKLPIPVKTCSNLDSFWGFIQPKFPTYAERRTYLWEQFTPLLDSLGLGGKQAPQHNSLTISEKPAALAAARNKRKVFIVHGRDNGTKEEANRFITNIGLEAIILHEQASSGMTIIEKIEHYSNDADFALILYTACDHGKGIHESKSAPKHRARQNVVFEHGYLMAKLGRENVCALVKGDIEIPNDISGVVYVPLDSNEAWQAEVLKELKACGYETKDYF